MNQNKRKSKKIQEITERIKNMPDLTEENLKPEDYAVPNGFAHHIARESKKIKTAQLRKFFNEIKRLQRETKSSRDIGKVKMELIKMIPELVFATGRELITNDFYNLLEACILKEEKGKMVCRFEKYEEFENFVSFLEAIVAYYKIV
ncbi:MAG: type III-A CRISPR-associated protein Csm2 [candidate division WOR-3 bacterium]|nr:type III-A CRISPR-associated protein Csm2 [candidate division WOR-3 bacterium]